jgi:formate dehydrogenase major subunit
VNKVKKALAKLDFLVSQDIFLTETAELADVILPATSYLEKTGTYTNTDRRVQIGRPALRPPGEARLDWQIVADISTRMGYPMRYERVEEIFDEMVSLTNEYRGLDYEILGRTGRLWPAPDRAAPDGEQILFDDGFPTADHRGKMVPCEFQPAREPPDVDYPFILNTGRLLEHWHTGTMTRRSYALDAISPAPFVEIHPDDLARLGVAEGDQVAVSSRRGRIALPARRSTKVTPGSVFIPFHFREAAANVLTLDAIDPFGKIPTFKLCAVRIERAAEAAE